MLACDILELLVDPLATERAIAFFSEHALPKFSSSVSIGVCPTHPIHPHQ